MGRTTGIQSMKNGQYKVDKVYRKQRIQQSGFTTFEEAESWLIRQLEILRSHFIHGTQGQIEPSRMPRFTIWTCIATSRQLIRTFTI